MLESVLPSELLSYVQKINQKNLNEIRLRVSRPIVVNVGGQAYFLGENGLVGTLDKAIIATKSMVEDIVFRASECSVYSVNEQLKKGFIVMKGGLRVGIGGSIVSENGNVKTLTDFTSVNIRIPHEIKNACLDAFDLLVTEGRLNNTLIISPPGAGKTTFLRDFVYQLSLRNYSYNVTVLDERGELDIKESSLGNFADIISFASKKVGFENAIRSLSPHVIVTDELGGVEDAKAVEYAIHCGVKILASVHAETIEELSKKESLTTLLKDKAFKRFVVLSSLNGPGTIEGIYNENFSRLNKWNS